jgi:hypothetical protein
LLRATLPFFVNGGEMTRGLLIRQSCSKALPSLEYFGYVADMLRARVANVAR